ncbi:uncharacterized protein STEHIDRAFT_100561 [Stereum hirsutum FP-91666 SS1]|uniref:uncharacterized protein n=1 Tax=Stereum hirsutum (strain FP-91666) TaxID=721885 RepID=UPI000444A42C|nr:uncharacterized protein STEHIDRAFT_100561 [Stereum hirsutum FP-91666 SS1]EIM84495.1 hypothetical protein STEHIDRAFT_100561 [Stereum hirsutum FP-91666 SS1]
MPAARESGRCFTCRIEMPGNQIKRCGRCKGPQYCSEQCQLADWPSHKGSCQRQTVWYDKYRACEDGSIHEGRLELITWPSPTEGTGWGACLLEEADDLKRKFETQFNGDQNKFFKYWPQGFRWTCCGTDGGMTWGCDHHGTGKKPCTCDYCRAGTPLPDDIYRERSATRYGLRLERGPDPRS